MLRALLDTNVLISAAIRPSGPPGQIVTAVLMQGFEHIVSPQIIEQVEKYDGIAIVTPRDFLD